MIQRAVYTWRTSRPGWSEGGWETVGHHQWAWSVSAALARRHFDEVVLYTDPDGARTVGALPVWTDVQVLEDWPRREFWGVAKLQTQSLQREPYLHIDGDFFLWEFPDTARHAAVVTQGQEARAAAYFASARAANKHRLAPHVVLPPLDLTYNAGVVGGNDLARLHRYAKDGLAGAEKAAELTDSGVIDVELDRWNYFFEQYQLRAYFSPLEMTQLGHGNHLTGHACYDHVTRNLRKRPEVVEQVIARAVEHGFSPPR